MDRKMIDGLVGTMWLMSLTAIAVLGAFTIEPLLQRLGFDHDSMVNKIVLGTIIGTGVMLLCALLTFAVRRMLERKDK